MIRQIQECWHGLEKDIRTVAKTFQISAQTARKYISMPEEEIKQLDAPRNYKKRATIMDDYINIIFKMMKDGLHDDIIYFYVRRQGYGGSRNTLWDYIYCIEKNNFPERKPMNQRWILEWRYPEDVTVIRRNALLKYLLTRNPKVKRDEAIGIHINAIKEKYPAAVMTEEIFSSFHSIIMGDNPGRLDEFLETYRNTKISTFCNGIERDIAPVKNAISLEASSGFVEGNNNKFKLIKRIVYGRSGLVNLSKKCFLVFSANRIDFSLNDLI